MGLNVTKMKPKKSYEHVVEQIQSAIFSGELCEGERLPSEMKLKDMFDTSRGTVREALRVLEQKGLVSVRTGVKGGARVRPARISAFWSTTVPMGSTGLVTPAMAQVSTITGWRRFA